MSRVQAPHTDIRAAITREQYRAVEIVYRQLLEQLREHLAAAVPICERLFQLRLRYSDAPVLQGHVWFD